ncbi:MULTISPECIES: TolC family protein [unclassified Clostridium]|uniref:TolC family protein n=1 Tax=unclassified Clostridium TaxID=2614128 RepID=UPI0002981F7C|nr:MULTISPECIES: TolC family protein [unclassified Clostridium]EKQ51570.1 MAG: outer membrane protein [Clostridium sp. Maddingley MBC34-26]
MKKSLSKIIAIAIWISIISGGIVPVFAAETIQSQNANNSVNTQIQGNVKPILTLDESIKAAIDNSEILELDEKKITDTDKTNDVNEKIDDNPQLVGKTEIPMPDDRKDLNEDIREINLKQVKQQKEFDEDKLTQKVTTAYNSIVTSQMGIEKAKKDIELKTKELNIAKVKKDDGMITETDLNANELRIEDLKDKLKTSENTLKDAEDSFKVLTGKDVTNYSLERDIKFDKFTIDGSIDEYLDNVMENYLKYSTKLVELNKDYFNDSDHKVEDVTDDDKPSDDKPVFNDDGDINSYKTYQGRLDGYYQEREMYAFKLSMRLAYLNAKLGTYESEINLNEAKKQFKEQLRTLYTNLNTLEDNINLLKKNILLNNKQLSIARVKYGNELITELDFNNQVVNSEDLDIQLRTAIDRYNTIKEEIQKPWIAFSNSQNSKSIKN